MNQKSRIIAAKNQSITEGSTPYIVQSLKFSQFQI